MVANQETDKLEGLAKENRRLLDLNKQLEAEVRRVRQTNALLAEQYAEKCETVVMLEAEAKKRARARKR